MKYLILLFATPSLLFGMQPHEEQAQRFDSLKEKEVKCAGDIQFENLTMHFFLSVSERLEAHPSLCLEKKVLHMKHFVERASKALENRKDLEAKAREYRREIEQIEAAIQK